MQIREFCTGTIICFMLFTGMAYCQDELKNQMRYADSLQAAGNYYDAVTEYERAIYFDSSGVITLQARISQGQAYAAGARWAEASESYIAALQRTHEPGMVFRIRELIIRSGLLGRRFTLVNSHLDAIEKDSLRQGGRQYANYWRGWAAMLQDRWELAAEYFSRCDTAEYLKNFCFNVQKSKYPVSFINAISYVLPGSGLIYTGEYTKGIIALGWNALFGYITVHALLDQRPGDAFLTGELLWMRFYFGSAEEAGRSALGKNTEISNTALHYLEKEFQGAKP